MRKDPNLKQVTDAFYIALNYQEFPKNTIDQRTLIKEFGYKTLNKKPMHQAEDRQIHSVALRIYQDSLRLVENLNLGYNEEERKIIENIRRLQRGEVRSLYERVTLDERTCILLAELEEGHILETLYDTFKENISLSELKKMLGLTAQEDIGF